MSIGVQSLCTACDRREPPRLLTRGRRSMVVHPLYSEIGQQLRGEFLRCKNFDTECRHVGESFGYIFFAWFPRTCRNGRRRWLTWLERHQDGTFTYCDRAF